MPFNSNAATLLARLQQAIDNHINTISRKDPKVKVLLGDMEDLSEELPRYQLIDIQQLVANIDQATTDAILRDVVNSNTFHLPFDRIALWYGQSQMGFLRIDDDRLTIGLTQFAGKGKTAIIPIAAGVNLNKLDNYLLNPEVKKMLPEAWEDAEKHAVSVYALACVLSFLIEHKKIDINHVDVPIQRNTKRQKRGKLPYSEYKQVAFTQTIKPHGEHQGGHHASPRFHVRAGHWRHLSRDRKVWVRAALVGDPSRGSIIKTYKLDAPAHA